MAPELEREHERLQQMDIVCVSRSALVAAMEAELKDYFFDGCDQTLGQHAIDHIIGCTLARLLEGHPKPKDLVELWLQATLGEPPTPL